MIKLLEWFDSLPFFYYEFGLASLAIFAVLASRSRVNASETLRSEATFLVFCGLALFAWRWPTFFASYALTPDEGISVAGALKLPADAVPWRGFDSTPNGPLSSYVLASPALLGWRVDFLTSRVIGAGLLIAALWALYYAFKWTCGSRVARLSLLPPVIFLSLANQSDFIQFSNEYMPMFLTTIALTATGYIAYRSGSRWSRHVAATVAGLSIGAMTFAGLQVLSIAAALLVLLTAALVSLKHRCPGEAAILVPTAISALCFAPGVILFSIWWTRELGDAVIAYLKAPLANTDTSFLGWHFLWTNAKAYAVFLVACLALFAVGSAAMIGKKAPAKAVSLWVASGLLVLASFYAVYQPHEAIAHYVILSIVPLSCCIATVVYLSREAGLWQGRERLISLSFVAVFAVPALSVATVSRNPFLGYTAHHWKNSMSELSERIARHASPGSEIVIWGWMPECYVQTRTFMATRDAQTGPQIREGPYRQYYRERFMTEIQARPPSVFVDVVGPDSWKFNDRATQAHESFPALAAFINENYTIQEPSGASRIYKRRR